MAAAALGRALPRAPHKRRLPPPAPALAALLARSLRPAQLLASRRPAGAQPSREFRVDLQILSAPSISAHGDHCLRDPLDPLFQFCDSLELLGRRSTGDLGRTGRRPLPVRPWTEEEEALGSFAFRPLEYPVIFVFSFVSCKFPQNPLDLLDSLDPIHPLSFTDLTTSFILFTSTVYCVLGVFSATP
jgi:hypothetical protein